MHLLHDPQSEPAPTIAFDDFLKVDIRIGTVIAAETYEGARQPSYRLRIDFGPAVGEKKSVAQVTAHYAAQDLIGRQIAAVVNFPVRQIGKTLSEVLTLGFADEQGGVVLFSPDHIVPNGSRLF